MIHTNLPFVYDILTKYDKLKKLKIDILSHVYV